MLNGFARHGLFDLTVHAKGDLEVDSHHTIEDTGIVLGQAILEAIGDKAGIKRYGHFMLPMDETLTLCAVDLSGRPYLNYNAEFVSDKMGEMDTGDGKGIHFTQFLTAHDEYPPEDSGWYQRSSQGGGADLKRSEKHLIWRQWKSQG